MTSEENFKGYKLDAIHQSLQVITENSGYFSVITVFSIIDESIHLSRIAKLIGKGKSTVSGYMDVLLEQKLIEIDVDKTINTRGSKKYYRLSEYGESVLQYQKQRLSQEESNQLDEATVQQIFEKYNNREEFLKLVTNEAKELMEKYGEKPLRNYFLLAGEMNRNIEKLAVNQYLDMASKLHKGKKFDNAKIGMGTIFNTSAIVKVATFEHVMKLKQATNLFIESIKQIELEIKEDIEKRIEQGQITEEEVGLQNIYLSLSPIFKE